MAKKNGKRKGEEEKQTLAEKFIKFIQEKGTGLVPVRIQKQEEAFKGTDPDTVGPQSKLKKKKKKSRLSRVLSA